MQDSTSAGDQNSSTGIYDYVYLRSTCYSVSSGHSNELCEAFAAKDACELRSDAAEDDGSCLYISVSARLMFMVQQLYKSQAEFRGPVKPGKCSNVAN